MNAVPAQHAQPPLVATLRSAMSNMFLVHGTRAILVDTGNPGNGARMLAHLARHNVAPHDITLILLTHGHVDHFGSAAELQHLTGAPVAIHRNDIDAVQRGRNPPLPSTRLRATMLKPFLTHRAPPVEPTIVFDGTFDLSSFGVDGTVLHTPGHTSGSVSMVLASGEIIAGDIWMGGHMGGAVQPQMPRYHYFVEDRAQLHNSMRTLLRLDAHTIYVGHGGPLASRAVAQQFGETISL